MRGSVTLYLSFSFVLIMALILTLLEGARASAAASCADMQMTTSVESVLGEFYRPLFEKYQVFAIDTRFSEATGNPDHLADMMLEYSNGNSFGLAPQECSILSTVPFLTQDGSEFIRQTCDYEKNCAIVDTIDTLLDRFSLLTGQGKAYTVYERQMEIEDKLATIDRNTIKLMECIDGVVSNFGRVGYVNDSFVKKLVTGPVDMATVGINNPEVYVLLEGQYTNPQGFCESMVKYLNDAALLVEPREKKQEEISSTEAEYSKACEALCVLEAQAAQEEQKKAKQGEDDGDSAENEQLLSARNGVEALSRTLETLREEYRELNDAINENCLMAGVHADELMRLYESSRMRATDALKLIEEDREISSVTGPLITAFGELLESSKDCLSEDMYASIGASYTRMRAYAGLDGTKPDYELMGETLQKDAEAYVGILENVDIGRDISQKAQNYISGTDISGWTESAQAVLSAISDVTYEGLVFDYSDMTTESVFDEIGGELKDTVAEGILGMILPEDRKLSDRKLTGKSLPSGFLESVQHMGDIGGLIADGLSQESGAQAFINMNSAADVLQVDSELEGDSDSFMDKLLLLLYITEHFGSFADEVMTGETALEYEQEYILSREKYDTLNLSEVASRIMLIRMVTAGAYVMSDSGLRLKAQEMATLLVGFTKLPFLVSIVKYALLFGWGTQQALVETAAILYGKKVPVLTTKSSFCIEPLNILTLTPQAIKLKVKAFPESSVSLIYNDYLLFLLLTQSTQELCMGALDLIQENLRWAYDDKFRLGNCIAGFSAQMTLECESRYMTIFDGLYGDVSAPDGYGFVRTEEAYYR